MWKFCVWSAVELMTLLGGAEKLIAQQVPPPITLASIYLALDSASPSIRGARANARAAEYRVAAAGRLSDPAIQLQLMNRDLPGFGLNDPLGMNQVQLTQMVPLGGKLGLQRRIAVARSDAARESVAEVTWSRRAAAAMAFFELQALDGRMSIARETRRLLEDVSKSATQRYGVGEGRQADVLRAQLEVNRMAGEIEDLLRMRAGAAARLNGVLNRTNAARVGETLRVDLPDQLPPLDTLIARAFRSRGMLRSAGADLRAATAATRLARSELWPDLEIGVSYGQRGMPDGGVERMMSLMLGATLPIWAGSRQLQMREEAAAEAAMAGAELEAVRADTRGRIEEAVARFEGATRLRHLYTSAILPQARATAQSAAIAYQSGDVDFMTMLDAVMQVNGYRDKQQQIDAEAGGALVELEMLTGTPLISGNPPVEPSVKGGR